MGGNCIFPPISYKYFTTQILPNLFASVTMVSFAAYSSLQSNENVSLSDMAMENVEALAQDINPLCPNRCVDPPEGQCLCNGIWYKLTEFDWGTGGSPIE